ncbi:MAG: hypothetical protein ABIV06_00790 [Thermoanaerobaculia bacterium]
MATRTLAIALFLTSILTLGVPASSAAASGSGQPRPAIPISPGETAREVETSGSCPTFSWSPAPNGGDSEIAIYELREGNDGVEPVRVLSRRFPSGATSWTPARAECLPAGGRFAWIVRSVAEGDSVSGEWSAARRFSIPASPSNDEVAAALEVLRHHFEAGSAAEPSNGSAAIDVPSRQAPATRSAASSSHVPDGVAGSAAIRGELAGGSGETYGVLGISNSAAGAGLAAINTANGADVRLDGSAAGATDLALSEAGIDRSSPGSETFDIRNSGAGTMTLRVDGQTVLTSSALDWNGLANIPAGFADGIDDDTVYSAGNQLTLSGATMDVVEGAGSGLDADTLDALDSSDFVTTSTLNWASVRRRFYLTTAPSTGNGALTACTEPGFHMASLWEIWDVSNLVYDAAGMVLTDSGSGPPAGTTGWVRTGYASSGGTGIGTANCNAWTSASLSFNGTVVYLSGTWGDFTNDDGAAEVAFRMSPWRATSNTCNFPNPVWCVQD